MANQLARDLHTALDRSGEVGLQSEMAGFGIETANDAYRDLLCPLMLLLDPPQHQQTIACSSWCMVCVGRT
jgi:hypothetical protein